MAERDLKNSLLSKHKICQFHLKKNITNLHTNTLNAFTLSEIGARWAPAIINTTSELIFIGKHHKILSNNVSFWIGGAAVAEGKIEMSDYMKHSLCPGR